MTTKEPVLLIYGIKPYTAKKNEAYMGPPQLKHFKAILAAWRSELSSEASRTVAHMQAETVTHPDLADCASQEADITLELRSRDRDYKLIKKIDESILRLDSGEFGCCENCGEDIGLRRLEARPTAVLCIDCKTLDEIREKQLS